MASTIGDRAEDTARADALAGSRRIHRPTVARALGLSSGNVRVIHARALGKIRNHLSSKAMGITGRATETAHSLLSAILSSGTARIGAAVSAPALSTAPLLPAVILGADPSSRWSDMTAPAAEVKETESPPALPFEDALSAQVHETPAERSPAGAHTPVGAMPFEAPQSSRPAPDNDGTLGAGPASADLVDVPDMSTPIVEDVIEPLAQEVVDDTLPGLGGLLGRG